MTPAADMACRRCGQVQDDTVVIWGADRTGALTPRVVQCRGRCNRKTARQDTPSRAVTMTANRPGRCAGCERDIIPGDVLARAGGQSFHYECAPPEAPQWKRRDRARTRR